MNSAERIVTRYRVQTPQSLEQAAEALAGEQSSSTFVDIPLETDELRRRHRGRVEEVKRTGSASTPALPGSLPPEEDLEGSEPYVEGEVEVSFPLHNLGPNLPTLMATVAGNLFELKQLSGVRLMDIQLPDGFVSHFEGPAFGIPGTRELSGVREGPIIGTIVKPSVGLSPEQTADLVGQLAGAGIDFVKDDELMADPPHSPFEERLSAVMDVINEEAQRNGKKVMYAFNITHQEIDTMRRYHDRVAEAGGTCVMVSLNHVGVSGVHSLRKHASLPIHGHRNGWGMYTRCPQLGMSFTAYQKTWRLAGTDHLHVNGLRNKFWEPDGSVLDSLHDCLSSLGEQRRPMPVISSGQWGGQAPDTYREIQTTDVMYLAGGGIMGHPGGPERGLRALRQAWEAAVEGIELEEYARTRPELRHAIDAFGGRSS